MAVCRFAPSPTGRLHLGGARTALFNWAWARHSGGTFLLRIEDTDRQRSRPEHEEAIIAALDWLGMERDGPAVRQSERAALYRAAAERLVEEGKAYRCYATAAELDELRAEQEREGRKPQYDRRWRGRTDWPAAGDYCLRFATPTEGDCAISDLIRGEVSVANKEFDDPVILRADGSATYNFAAVVDDGEMGVTDVIRGEDHLTNTLRQVHIHRALGQEIPRFAHLPLILGRRLDANGEPATLESGEPAYERLSKRNMAVDVDHYRREGFIAPAMVNYLAQLGWTQPGQEIYTPADLAAAFELGKVNKSAARFDLERLQWINQQHLRALPPAEVAELAGIEASSAAIETGLDKARTLVELRDELSWIHPPKGLKPMLEIQLGNDRQTAFDALLKQQEKLQYILVEFQLGSKVQAAIDAMAKREEELKSILEKFQLGSKAQAAINAMAKREEELKSILEKFQLGSKVQTAFDTLAQQREEMESTFPMIRLEDDNRVAFAAMAERLEKLTDFTEDAIKQEIKGCCKEYGLRFPRLGMPMRAALTGKSKSSDVALVASILGRKICRERMQSMLKLYK